MGAALILRLGFNHQAVHALFSRADGSDGDIVGAFLGIDLDIHREVTTTQACLLEFGDGGVLRNFDMNGLGRSSCASLPQQRFGTEGEGLGNPEANPNGAAATILHFDADAALCVLRKVLGVDMSDEDVALNLNCRAVAVGLGAGNGTVSSEGEVLPLLTVLQIVFECGMGKLSLRKGAEDCHGEKEGGK